MEIATSPLILPTVALPFGGEGARSIWCQGRSIVHPLKNTIPAGNIILIQVRPKAGVGMSHRVSYLNTKEFAGRGVGD